MATRPRSTGGAGSRSTEPVEDPEGPAFEEQASGETDTDTPTETPVDPSGAASPEEEAATSSVDAESLPNVSGELLEVHGAVVDALKRGIAADLADGQVVAQDLAGQGNVQGVGITPADEKSGGVPGEPALTLYVVEEMVPEDAKRVLVDAMGISAAADDDVPVNVVVTGVIDAYTNRARWRPAPGGVSAGHFAITAGTLGCFARGRSAPRSNYVLALSNNHVFANSNAARLGDNILQPGPYDGGRNPADRIAILERFVPINFAGGVNYVDAATGWCWSGLVRYPFLMYLSGARQVLFRIASAPVNCRVGMNVGKSGRTTQLTQGIIRDCNATIRVNYGSGRIALFSDQIAITGVSGNFSAGGDSGSVIWTWDSRRNPVGLLFAGGGNTTFANKIGRVLPALDITIRS